MLHLWSVLHWIILCLCPSWHMVAIFCSDYNSPSCWLLNISDILWAFDTIQTIPTEPKWKSVQILKNWRGEKLHMWDPWPWRCVLCVTQYWWWMVGKLLMCQLLVCLICHRQQCSEYYNHNQTQLMTRTNKWQLMLDGSHQFVKFLVRRNKWMREETKRWIYRKSSCCSQLNFTSIVDLLLKCVFN